MTNQKNNVMEIAMPLSPDKAASVRKVLENEAWGDLSIETIERVEQTGMGTKYVLRYLEWDEASFEKRKLERKRRAITTLPVKGRGMVEVLNGQMAYRKATPAHKMATRPMLKKGYRLTTHLTKVERANKK